MSCNQFRLKLPSLIPLKKHGRKTLRIAQNRLSRNNLGLERLEDRYLLTAAVGSFERTDGYVRAVTAATVEVDQSWRKEVASTPGSQAMLDFNSATAILSGTSGMGIGQHAATASALTAIGQSIVVPQVTAATINQVTVSGDASVWTGYGPGISSDGGQAVGTFEFNAPSPSPGDLWFHGHLFVAIYGGALESGDASVVINSADATATGLSDSQLFASFNGVDFSWAALLPDGVVSGNAVGGVNLHFTYVIPITDGTVAEFTSFGNVELVADSTTGSAQGSLATTTASWGFVLPAGQELTPGDFNGDGAVNGADYDLWKIESPLADGNLDGKVDEHDYCIWAENANAILVSTNVDENDGNYSAGDLSLREAIALAADGSHPGSDIIAFDCDLIGQTITLTMGQLLVNGTNPVKILGPGADHLTISGNNSLINLFAISSDSTLSHLKLANAGFAAVSYTATNNLLLESLQLVSNANGVRHSGNGSGNLTIVDTLVADNTGIGIVRTTHSPPSETATVTISGSTVRDNGSLGIDLRNLDVSVSGSEVTGNGGAGVAAKNDGDMAVVSLAISDSTIAQNNGDGISLTRATGVGTSTVADIRNTTISGNSGIGLSANNATATLTNVTVTQNSVTTGGATAGLYAGTGGTITLHNTIVAQNYSAGVSADLGRSTVATAGSFSVGISSHNLIGAVGNSNITSSQNNIILGSGVDAGLTALGAYGGRTRTHALRQSSLAIDGGDNAKATAVGLLYDQRGQGNDRFVDWDTDLDQRVDIGAFELALGEYFS